MSDILIKEEITKTAIVKMFSDKYFSISTYNDICAMLHVIPDGETLKMLRPLHCIDYSDMSKPLRKWLYETVLSVAKCDGFNLKQAKEIKLNSAFIDAEIISEEPNFFKQLIFPLTKSRS